MCADALHRLCLHQQLLAGPAGLHHCRVQEVRSKLKRNIKRITRPLIRLSRSQSVLAKMSASLMFQEGKAVKNLKKGGNVEITQLVLQD